MDVNEIICCCTQGTDTLESIASISSIITAIVAICISIKAVNNENKQSLIEMRREIFKELNGMVVVYDSYINQHIYDKETVDRLSNQELLSRISTMSYVNRFSDLVSASTFNQDIKYTDDNQVLELSFKIKSLVDDLDVLWPRLLWFTKNNDNDKTYVSRKHKESVRRVREFADNYSTLVLTLRRACKSDSDTIQQELVQEIKQAELNLLESYRKLKGKYWYKFKDSIRL